jgi:hypothetical protein
MAKSKEMSSRSASFAKGGKGKMFGKQHTGTQKPGQTATKATSKGGKFAKGGSGHMFGKQSANPRRPGVTGK